MCSAVAPALGDHLWQSTLFVALAGLVTLVLQKNQARTRYWLWLAASIKFLLPFSLLVAIGRHLAGRGVYRAVQPEIYLAIEQFGQPFTSPALSAPRVAPSTASGLPHVLPILLSALWLAGFLVVLFLCYARWRQVSSAVRKSVPLRAGREVAALRRMERLAGIRQPIKVLLSPAALEPGIFGMTRPLLLWPRGISQHLDDGHLEAILVHEVWHVRRRDNLAAAMHMLVEAVFWFHPLVWWLSARLVAERERACDEEVLALGSERRVYAESILKVCEFCVGSPLACISGVSGADLKKRMVQIMYEDVARKLDFRKRLLVTVAGVLAVAAPLAFGVLNAAPGRARLQDPAALPAATFENVSVTPSKPAASGPNRSRLMFSLDDGGFAAKGVSLATLIRLAYHVQDSQLSGGPDWLNSERFDIEAKMSNSTRIPSPTAPPGPEGDQRALQSLLSNYFKLSVHSEAKNVPVYELLLDGDSSKLQESAQPGSRRSMRLGRGELTSEGAPLSFLVEQLSLRLGRTVVDKTGLKGNYNFNLHWTPDAAEDARLEADGLPGGVPSEASRAAGASLFTAIQDQLGLKLEPRADTVTMLVIDHVEKPAEN